MVLGPLVAVALVVVVAAVAADRGAATNFFHHYARSLGLVYWPRSSLPALTPLLGAGDKRWIEHWMQGALPGEPPLAGGIGQLVWEEREEGRRDEALEHRQGARPPPAHDLRGRPGAVDPALPRGLPASAPGPDRVHSRLDPAHAHALDPGGEHGLLAALRAAGGRRPGRDRGPPAALAEPRGLAGRAPARARVRDPCRNARGVRGPAARRTRATSPTSSTPRGGWPRACSTRRGRPRARPAGRRLAP